MRRDTSIVAAFAAICAAAFMTEARSADSSRTFADAASDAARILDARAADSPMAFADAAPAAVRAAESGDAFAGYALALVAREETRVTRAYVSEAARARYLEAGRAAAETAAAAGDMFALYLLAYDREDTNLLSRAARGGCMQACNTWASRLITFPADTEEATERHRAEAFGLFKTAADCGDVNGLCNLGTCYVCGFGVEADDKLAYDCFKRAAEKNHPEAMNNLGWFHSEGRAGLERDPAEATKWFKRSASLYNRTGAFNYGIALLHGMGVKQDPAGASRFLKRAADAGSFEAMDEYALALWRGDILKEDVETAIAYFKRAAEAGFAGAMDHLAICYDVGKGVPEDPRQALEWKMRAKAARGDETASAWLRANAADETKKKTEKDS